jgi:hypothetical protein
VDAPAAGEEFAGVEKVQAMTPPLTATWLM